MEIREKRLYVNNTPVDEPYVQFVDATHVTAPRDNYGPVVVPERQFFVLGDNRDQSYDSRYWGFVDVKYLQGRPTVIYWSRSQGMPRWERIGTQIK